MNLNPRCQKMLDNQMQCPNEAVMDTDYCVLHTALAGERNLPPTNTDAEIQKQDAVKEV